MLYFVLSLFSCVQLPATPWTAASQAPPVHGILQARILENCHTLAMKLKDAYFLEGKLWPTYIAY